MSENIEEGFLVEYLDIGREHYIIEVCSIDRARLIVATANRLDLKFGITGLENQVIQSEISRRKVRIPKGCVRTVVSGYGDYQNEYIATIEELSAKLRKPVSISAGYDPIINLFLHRTNGMVPLLRAAVQLRRPSHTITEDPSKN